MASYIDGNNRLKTPTGKPDILRKENIGRCWLYANFLSCAGVINKSSIKSRVKITRKLFFPNLIAVVISICPKKF